MFRCSAHRLSQTCRAESLRCHSAPVVPGLDAPVASVPPLRLRDLRRLRRAIRSRLRSRLQSLRLHSVTQAPSAGPALTSEGRCRCTFIRLSVPEPEKLSSSRLDRHTVRLLPRLSACLLTLRKTERTMLTHRPFRLPTSRAGIWSHAPRSVHSGTTSHAGREK